jgi:hypothetical protein
MAIDSGIYSQIRQPEAPNLLGMYGQAQQLQGMQQQNRLAELAFQDRERGIADANAQREAVKGFGADTTANYNRLLQTGNLGAAQGYQKSLAEQTKARDESQKSQLEAAAKRIDLAGQAFGFVRQAPTLENAVAVINNLAQNGIYTPEQAQQYIADVQSNPASIPDLAERAYRAALDTKEQLMKVSTVNTGGQQVTQGVDPVTGMTTRLGTMQNTISPDAQLSAATTRRGQDLTYKSAAEGRDAAKAKTGGSATEDERKSAGYAVRMEDALRTLEAVGKEDPSATKPGIGTALTNMLPEAAANYVRPENRQRVEAAQLDALDAALTLATGAAYTKEQLKGLSRSYFAQPGDRARTIEEKTQRLKTVVETARVRAGRAESTINPILGRTGQNAPKAGPAQGVVEDGYVYLGGDPADPKSWKKQ